MWSYLTLLVGLMALVSISTQQSPYLPAVLVPWLNPVNLFDGPSSIANAPTTNLNQNVTAADMRFYNYIAAAIDCTNIQNLTCSLCQNFNSNVSYNNVLYNNSVSTAGMITVLPARQEIVVSFRGTENFVNVLLDVNLVQITVTPEIKVHHGFYIAAMSLYDRVIPEVQTQLTLNPGFKVTVIGQSLGAAMASVTMFLFNYRQEFPGVSYKLVTLGQPRTGNKGYADFMNNLAIPVVRVVNRADIVVHLIPVSVATTTVVIGDYYYHHGTEYWVNNGNERYCRSDIYEDPTCSDSLGPLYSVVDHLFYFNVSYTACVLENPELLTENPFIDFPSLSVPGVPVLNLLYPLLG